MRKTVGTCFILLRIALIAATARLSSPYMENDLPQTLLSFIGPFAALMASILLLLPFQQTSKWIITKWGLFTGSSLFVILQIYMLSTHHQLILDDGVAYWAFVNLPSFYIAIPLCLVGAFVGWIADLIKNKRSNQPKH